MRARTLALPLVLVACSRGGPLGPSRASLSSMGSAQPPSPIASASASGAPTATPPDIEEAQVLLRIPDRRHDPKAPPSGWCGETAIQEALLYVGVWAPQSYIHRSGKSVHPDLYSQDIPTALAELAVRTSTYLPTGKGGFGAYRAWVQDAIDRGDPVIAGVKILPTEHPEWGLDHFVLVVGYGKKGLLVNTTWGGRRWVADTTTAGLSLKNAFYAIRVRGLAQPKNAIAARLAVIEEGMSTLKLAVSCEGLVPGTSYRLERRSGVWDTKPSWSESVNATSARLEREVTIEAEKPARFRCVPLTS